MKYQAKWRWWALLAIVLMAGCNTKVDRAAQLVGKWKADNSNMKLPATKPGDVQAKAMAESMKEMMGSITLDLKADKTFAMNLLFPSSGTWTLDEEKNLVVLTITTLNKVDVSKSANAQSRPLNLQIAPDNSRMTLQNPSGAGTNGMIFIKTE